MRLLASLLRSPIDSFLAIALLKPPATLNCVARFEDEDRDCLAVVAPFLFVFVFFVFFAESAPKYLARSDALLKNSEALLRAEADFFKPERNALPRFL